MKCPRDKKGTKKYVPRVPGTQTRDKICLNLLEKSFGSVLGHLKDIVQNLIGGYFVFP